MENSESEKLRHRVREDICHAYNWHGCYVEYIKNYSRLQGLSSDQPPHPGDQSLTGAMSGAPLVVQWLRICIAMQGTWVWSPAQEDLTCLRATEPHVPHSWACALERGIRNYRSPHSRKPVLIPNKRSHHSKKPAHAATSSRAAELEKVLTSPKTQHSQNEQVDPHREEEALFDSVTLWFESLWGPPEHRWGLLLPQAWLTCASLHPWPLSWPLTLVPARFVQCWSWWPGFESLLSLLPVMWL